MQEMSGGLLVERGARERFLAHHFEGGGCASVERLAPVDLDARVNLDDEFAMRRFDREEGEAVAEKTERSIVCAGLRGDRSSLDSTVAPARPSAGAAARNARR